MELRDVRDQYKFATRILGSTEEIKAGLRETESVWVCWEDDAREMAKVCRGTQDYVWVCYSRLATTDEKFSEKLAALLDEKPPLGVAGESEAATQSA